jgi:hypothetical protein
MNFCYQALLFYKTARFGGVGLRGWGRDGVLGTTCTGAMGPLAPETAAVDFPPVKLPDGEHDGACSLMAAQSGAAGLTGGTTARGESEGVGTSDG